MFFGVFSKVSLDASLVLIPVITAMRQRRRLISITVTAWMRIPFDDQLHEDRFQW